MHTPHSNQRLQEKQQCRLKGVPEKKLSIIPNRLACKKRNNFPGIKLVSVNGLRIGKKKFVVKNSRRQHKSKTGHFKSWKNRERLQTVG